MTTTHGVAITGFGMKLPGAATTTIADLLAEHLHAEAFDPKIRVGQKGVRYKDHATLLAMSAGQDALRNAGLPLSPASQLNPTCFGVVVSCNLGNVNTVVDVVRTLRSQHADATSAMDLPNASSNVMASGLAIRYGLQGPNLMLCNGATSSLDALHLAANCIRAGRAKRMLVVGVEVDNEVTRAFSPAGERWFNGAVAVVIEDSEVAKARNAHVRGRLGEYRFASHNPGRAGVAHGEAPDVTRHVGNAYGAEGLVQLLASSQRVAESARRIVLACGHTFGDAVVATLEVELYA